VQMLLKVERNRPIFAYIILWKVLSCSYAYIILIGALLFPHTQFFSLQRPIIPVHMYCCGISLTDVCAEMEGQGQCWGVITISVRTFKVFSPVLKMRIESFHIE